MMALSPTFRRVVAILVLASVVWATMSVVITVLNKRIYLYRATQDARQQLSRIRERRIDIGLLQQRLSNMMQSEALQRSVMVVGRIDRAASANLQQRIRKALDDVRGHLLSMHDFPPDKSSPKASIQFRARLDEKSFHLLITNLEQGAPRLQWEDLELAARGKSTTEPTALDLAARLSIPLVRTSGVSR